MVSGRRVIICACRSLGKYEILVKYGEHDFLMQKSRALGRRADSFCRENKGERYAAWDKMS
jgi:hypothetical protein